MSSVFPFISFPLGGSATFPSNTHNLAVRMFTKMPCILLPFPANPAIERAEVS